MKKLTASQQCIISEFRLLPETQLTLETPFNIARQPITLQKWENEQPPTQYIPGYSKAAHGLVQRGILIRDSTDIRFWLSLFGLAYIKRL